MTRKLPFVSLLILWINMIGLTQSASPMIDAIKHCDQTQIETLLSQTDQSWRTETDTPFPMLAAFFCNKTILQLFQQHGFDFREKGVIYLKDKKETFYGSLMTIAAGKGDLKMLQYLVEDLQIPVDDRAYNPATRQVDGWTALRWAVVQQHVDIVNYLIEQGADFLKAFDTDEQALSNAIQEAFPNISVLEQKLDSVFFVPEENNTPLIVAILDKDLDKVKHLVELGADINESNQTGWFPIHIAAEIHALNICRYLLEKGADLGVINKFGFTPLGIAQGNAFEDIAQLFLQHSTELQLSNKQKIEVVLQRDLKAVQHLQFSKDNKWLLVNDHLFDVYSGREITNYGGVIAKFTPNEAFLVQLVGQEGIPFLWNWKNSALIGQFAAEGGTKENESRNPYFSNQQIYCDANAQHIITANDSDYYGWNILTGKEVELPVLEEAALITTNDAGDRLLHLNTKSELALFDDFIAKQSIAKFSVYQEGFQIKMIHLNQTGNQAAIVYESLTNEVYSKIMIYDLTTQTQLHDLLIDDMLNAIAFNTKADLLAYTGTDTLIYLQELSSNTAHPLEKLHTKPIQCLVFSANGQLLASGSEDKSAHIYRVRDRKRLQTFKGYLKQDIGSKILGIQFSNNGQWLLNGRIAKIFDLFKLEVYNLFTTVATISGDKELIVKKGTKDEVLDAKVLLSNDYINAYPHALSAKQLVRFPAIKILKGQKSKIEKFALSPNNKFLASVSKNNKVIAWDIESGEQLFDFQGLHQIQDLNFDPFNQYVIIRYGLQGEILYPIKKGESIQVLRAVAFSAKGKWKGSLKDSLLLVYNERDEEVIRLRTPPIYTMPIVFSPNERYLSYFDTNHQIACYDIEQKKIIHHFNSGTVYTHAIFSPNSQYFILKSAKLIEVWSVKMGKKLYAVEEQALTNSAIALSPDSRFLATVGDQEYSIILRELSTGDPVFKILFPGSSLSKGQFIITTPDGYYMSTKTASSGLNFKKDFAVYPFEQFDLRFNRPDVILKRLGYASQTLITAYENAYKKRLDKLDFSPNQIQADFHLPQLNLLTENISNISSIPNLDIRVQAVDMKHALQSLHVWINDVPIYGRNGINLSDTSNDKTIEKNLLLNLSKGKNKIQLSCYNVQGVESLKQTFEIQYEPTKDELPTLHLIGIGATNYQNSEMNLDYPVKDIQDVFELFKQKQQDYIAIKTTCWFNEEATLANILQIREQLLQTKVDDIVILYYAGHGVFDKDRSYFLATYDMDFSNPSTKGVPYDTLEMLLEAIPARKKLILLDACHAGEIDEVYVDNVVKDNKKQGSVKFRSAKTSKPTYSTLNADESFELMKSLFVDLRRGIGATIIGSSGGLQPAMESVVWENSAFAYSLLRALRDEEADGVLTGVKNKQIMISELQQYLNYKVNELTDGLQQPTTRLENISNDFRIW